MVADACELTLNPDTAGVNVILTEENKKATYVRENQPHPDNPERFDCRQVLCEEGLTGRHYWEAEDFSAEAPVHRPYNFHRTTTSWFQCR